MAIYLDDQPMMWVGHSLAALLEAARKRLEPAGRIVVQVQVNGQFLVGPEIARHQNDPVNASDVRLASADPVELAQNTLQQLRSLLEQSGQALQEAGEAFQSDEAGRGMQALSRAMDLWHQLPQAVIQAAALTRLDVNAALPAGKTMTVFASDLAASLRGLRDGLTNRDTVALADALRYEWPRTVQAWDQLLANLQKKLQSEH